MFMLHWNVVCLCVSDFQEVLKLEPGNKQALNELQKFQIVCFKITGKKIIYTVRPILSICTVHDWNHRNAVFMLTLAFLVAFGCTDYSEPFRLYLVSLSLGCRF